MALTLRVRSVTWAELVHLTEASTGLILAVFVRDVRSLTETSASYSSRLRRQLVQHTITNDGLFVIVATRPRPPPNACSAPPQSVRFQVKIRCRTMWMRQDCNPERQQNPREIHPNKITKLFKRVGSHHILKWGGEWGTSTKIVKWCTLYWHYTRKGKTSSGNVDLFKRMHGFT